MHLPASPALLLCALFVAGFASAAGAQELPPPEASGETPNSLSFSVNPVWAVDGDSAELQLSVSYSRAIFWRLSPYLAWGYERNFQDQGGDFNSVVFLAGIGWQLIEPLSALSVNVGLEQGVWDDEDGSDDDSNTPALTFGLGTSLPMGPRWALEPGFSGEWDPGEAVKLGFQLGVSWSF